ncbi:MAG: CD3324 family protein [Clostridium sp.]|nr:CD3324 family protein [Clostridium sp.]
MCYVTAKQVLPIEVIEMIQNYIDGEYIYIPKKEGNKQQWGTTTNTRKELSVRNSKIYIDYKNGVSRRELAEKYFLSIKSIDRIILKEKSK